MRSLSYFVLLTLVLPALASPVRRHTTPSASTTNSANAYSGAAGMAQGGSVKGSNADGLLGVLMGDTDIINIDSSRHTLRREDFDWWFSDDFAENAGVGGSADSGLAAIGDGISKGHGGSQGLANSANSYSGQGGNANGGDVEYSDGLVNLDSCKLSWFIQKILTSLWASKCRSWWLGCKWQ